MQTNTRLNSKITSLPETEITPTWKLSKKNPKWNKNKSIYFVKQNITVTNTANATEMLPFHNREREDSLVIAGWAYTGTDLQ